MTGSRELSTKMGPTSVRHCYGLLRGPLRRAIKDRIIDDPCIDITLPPKPDIAKTFDDVLTASEVDALVAALTDPGDKYANLRTNHRYAALVFAGAWLGPRWNEAIGLRVCDLNPLRQEATIGRVVVNQNGAKTFTEAMSKTEDASTVPVPDPVMTVLVDHIKTYLPDAGREDFLFLTTRGTHPMRGNFGRDVLKAAAGNGRAGGPAHHLAHPAPHRRLPDVRRRNDHLRSPTPPRPQKPDHDRRGLHPSHARTIQRRPHPTRDLHERSTAVSSPKR